MPIKDGSIIVVVGGGIVKIGSETWTQKHLPLENLQVEEDTKVLTLIARSTAFLIFLLSVVYSRAFVFCQDRTKVTSRLRFKECVL